MGRLRNESGGAAYGTLLGILVTVGIGAGITVITQSAMGGGDVDPDNPLSGGVQDRVYQGKTIADMKAIATATTGFFLREGRYPRDIEELGASGMLPNLAATDSWGTAWRFESNDRHFILASLGSDGARGPKPPADWDRQTYAPDLIIRDGKWLQAPASALGQQKSLTQQQELAGSQRETMGR